MGSRRLEREWTNTGRSGSASSGYWDFRSSDFGNKSIPNSQNDAFVRLVERECFMEYGKTRILDIGCGTGIYSLAFADMAGPILGIDVSPKMIEYANRNAAAAGAHNAKYEVADWLAMDGDDPLITDGFDVTIAHMTPAICSAETFRRMLDVSNGQCFLTSYISRGSPIRDKMREISGSEEFSEQNKLLNALDMLWSMNLEPEIEYEVRRYSFTKTLDETKAFYINDMRTYDGVNDEMCREAEKYLKSLAVDGMVRDESRALVATIYWKMDNIDE